MGTIRERLVAPMLLMCVAACGGGGGPSAPAISYPVGGIVTGLSGSGLVLQNNRGNDLAVPAPGNFTFAGGLKSGAAYSVIVATQPSAPTQDCVVSNGSGRVSSANVMSVIVTCTTVPFTVLANQPPNVGYLSLLLTDGSVMVQSARDAGAFY